MFYDALEFTPDTYFLGMWGCPGDSQGFWSSAASPGIRWGCSRVCGLDFGYCSFIPLRYIFYLLKGSVLCLFSPLCLGGWWGSCPQFLSRWGCFFLVPRVEKPHQRWCGLKPTTCRPQSGRPNHSATGTSLLSWKTVSINWKCRERNNTINWVASHSIESQYKSSLAH